MSREAKWICEYCTYENFPNANKCTMCHGPKPLLSRSEDIYNLRAKEDASGGAETSKSVINCDNLHESFGPLKINDSESASAAGTCKQSKWHCFVCTYENWPKSKKCIMCNTSNQPSAQNSPKTSVKITPATPDRDVINEEKSFKRSRREDPGPTNNYEYDRRRREADWGWLNACQAVVEGDPNPVASFLEAGGDPTRQLTPSEVSLLNRPSAFDIGHTLVHLAIRFQREDMLAMLVTFIDGGGSGLKRVPSYIAPDLAKAIRRHAATVFNTKHSHSIPFPFFDETSTFVLPAEIEDLPASVQDQLYGELLDKDVQQQLEGEPAVINWSVEITNQLGSRLHALWNRSQGDCLLDSLMQATWGVFDRESLLRSALADALKHGAHLLYPRWLESEANLARQLEYTLSDSQWAEDWSSIVKRATQPGASLQQLHVFALAHVLRRPIIVYGVKFVKSFRGEALGYAGFEGVYLPLLWEPNFCTFSPITLGYTRGHFSALVPIENYSLPARADLGSKTSSLVEDNRGEQICYLPLVDRDRKLLPIHFLLKSEMGSEERLLRRWLDVNVTDGGLLVAQQRTHGRPLLVAQMLQEWLNHYKSLAQMSGIPYNRTIPVQDFSSDGETDDE